MSDDDRTFPEKVMAEFENGGEQSVLVRIVHAGVMAVLILVSVLLSIPIGIAKFAKRILRR